MTRSGTKQPTQKVPAKAHPRDATPHGIRAVAALLRRGVRPLRSRWAVLPLLAVVAGGAFLLGRGFAPASGGQPLPAYIGLPPHASLVWYDHYAQAQVEDWTYSVAGATNASLTAFYQDALPRDGWQCFRTSTMTAITREGTAYTGTSVYMTALRQGMKAQIYTADQQYGSYLLQGDLPANAVALKISLETEDQAACV